MKVAAPCVFALIGLFLVTAGEPAKTGPATEKRFPLLKVPPGFKATLWACDPLIEYPSVIAAGPNPGALFVAHDYVTGLGVEIVRRDEIRLVEDTDGDGYADKSTLIAKDFNSIQGLAYHNDTLYVMHAPFLTRLRYNAKTGVADQRKDLLTGLGLKPEDNPSRLHCANGVVVGYDGWLYLALGDNGCDVKRPEGDRLVFQGGGILRCRPDGSDLHIFSTGLRNIYDIALDADLNVFVRDNENDGGTYMIRVCHSFFGADHGYPYLYEARPDEAMPPIGDFGLGSSAGGVCYVGTQFPPEYRGNLFFCEWGRSVVRYPLKQEGSGFAKVKEAEFAAGDPKDPYGFHPTDIVVQRDGTMMVSDWADGQRPKRGRGRIYHIEYVRDGVKAIVGDSDTRRDPYGVWASLYSPKGEIGPLLERVASDPDPRARVQAVRAIADFTDPVLVKHRLDAGRGDPDVAKKLAELAKNQDPRVQLEIVIALGRLRWNGAPDWLRQSLKKPDATLGHAAMQTLRRADNWPAVLKLLDEPSDAVIWPIAVRAIAEQYDVDVVTGLSKRLETDTDAKRKLAYADALTRVYKKPGPWKYWGYRPGPKPANTEIWDRTDVIPVPLHQALADPDRELRVAVLKSMQREKVPFLVQTLVSWLEDEHDAKRAALLIAVLSDRPPAKIRQVLDSVIRDKRHSAENRSAALALFVKGLDEVSAPRLIGLAEGVEDGPVLAAVLRQSLKFPNLPAAVKVEHLKSPDADVRTAAIEVLGERKAEAGLAHVAAMLGDKDVRVRRAAAAAAGKLGAKPAIEPLLKLASDADMDTRRACLESLRLLKEPRAIPLALAALDDPGLNLPALACLCELAPGKHRDAIVRAVKGNPSAPVVGFAIHSLSLSEAGHGAIAEIQGETGILAGWRVTGHVPPDAIEQTRKQLQGPAATGEQEEWRIASGAESRLSLAKIDEPKPGAWFAHTKLAVPESSAVELLASSSGSLRIWLNGALVHRRDQPRAFLLDSERITATLAKGENRIVVEVGSAKGDVEFHLHFRKKSSKAEHEKLTQAALSRAGNPERGKKLFFNAEKSLCIKCHKLGETGERIGPELTGVGSRFSRVYLVESILEPSRTIAPSYGSVLIELKNGKQLTGVKVAQTETMLTLADNQGVKHLLKKADIEMEQPSPVSTMPEGLETRLSEDEFVDLIAFLASQKTAGK